MARPSADHDPCTTGSPICVTFLGEPAAAASAAAVLSAPAPAPATPPEPRFRIHTSSLPAAVRGDRDPRAVRAVAREAVPRAPAGERPRLAPLDRHLVDVAEQLECDVPPVRRDVETDPRPFRRGESEGGGGRSPRFLDAPLFGVLPRRPGWGGRRSGQGTVCARVLACGSPVLRCAGSGARVPGSRERPGPVFHPFPARFSARTGLAIRRFSQHYRADEETRATRRACPACRSSRRMRPTGAFLPGVHDHRSGRGRGTRDRWRVGHPEHRPIQHHKRRRSLPLRQCQGRDGNANARGASRRCDVRPRPRPL